MRKILFIVYRLQAAWTLFINLTAPIRLAYAQSDADYAVACYEEACCHYRLAPNKLWQAKIYWTGFVRALICKPIPQWFIDDWFGDAPLPVEG